MLAKSQTLKTEKRLNVRNGSGYVKLLHILGDYDLPDKVDMFSVVTLEKGCSIGPHEHSDDTEIYFGLSGDGIIDDNGTQSAFSVGDVNVCGGGGYHAISNTAQEPLKFIVLIVKE